MIRELAVPDRTNAHRLYFNQRMRNLGVPLLAPGLNDRIPVTKAVCAR